LAAIALAPFRQIQLGTEILTGFFITTAETDFPSALIKKTLLLGIEPTGRWYTASPGAPARTSFGRLFGATIAAGRRLVPSLRRPERLCPSGAAEETAPVSCVRGENITLDTRFRGRLATEAV
jgi:hypothetical protein